MSFRQSKDNFSSKEGVNEQGPADPIERRTSFRARHPGRTSKTRTPEGLSPRPYTTTRSVRHRGVKLRCDAEVVYAIPGAGMGIRFENDKAEEESLDGWLVQISDQIPEHRPEGTDIAASAKQDIILIICIVALVVAMAAALWLGLLP